jgi:hypothetical protein
VLHVADEDVSEVRRLTPQQAEVVDLLELNPGRRRVVRLTLAQWRQVDRLVARIIRSAGRPLGRTGSRT